MPNKYQPDFKRQVIKRYEKGESIKTLSQELHIAQSTIYINNIQFYNEVRPHQTLRFRTPQAFESAYYAKHGKSQENGV